MRVEGPSLAHLEQVGDEFAELISAGIRQAINVAAKDLKATTTPDDLGVIRRVFEKYTETTLVPFLQKQWDLAAGQQRERLLEAALTAAVPLPPVASTLSENYMATATNRLKGVSDEVWEHARGELVSGMQAGESIPQLRKRVQAATGLSKPRAEQIARTEVIGAQNRGSLEQMKASGYGGTKTWLATIDTRTRPAHATVNGTTVALEEKFSVGGASMDGPHDPAGPPGQTISCRCTLTYDVPEDELHDDSPGAGAYQTAGFSDLDDWDVEELTHIDDTTKDIRQYGRGDHTLEAMWKRQGFDGPPAVGDAEDLDELIGSGGREIYRGISGKDGPELYEKFRQGTSSYGGKGIYGNGTYFSYLPGKAEWEAKLYAHNGPVMRAVLRPDAKVVNYHDLQKMMIDEGLPPKVLFDPGRYATAKGYDAIESGEPEFHLVVLNRTALMVQKADEVKVPKVPKGPEPFTGRKAYQSVTETPMTPGVTKYTEGGYRNLNYFLRNPKGAMGAEESSVLGAMDRAFMNADRIEKPIQVLRGMSDMEYSMPGLKVGDVIQDRAYASTTIDEDTARFFASQQGDPAIWRITVPAGVKVVKIVGDEAELILDRQTKFRVTGISKTGETTWVDAEVVV